MDVYLLMMMVKLPYPIHFLERRQYNMLPLGVYLRDPYNRLVRFLLRFGSLSLLGFLDSAVVLEVDAEGVGGVHKVFACFDRYFVHVACDRPGGVENTAFLLRERS